MKWNVCENVCILQMTWPTKIISEWELYFFFPILFFWVRTFEMEIIFLFGFVHTIIQPMSFPETFSIFHLFHRLPLRLCHFGLWLKRRKKTRERNKRNKNHQWNCFNSRKCDDFDGKTKNDMCFPFHPFFHSFGLGSFFGLLFHFSMKSGFKRKISKWWPPAGLFNVVESFFSCPVCTFFLYKSPLSTPPPPLASQIIVQSPDGVHLEFLFSEIKVEFICVVNKSSLKMWIRKKLPNWIYRLRQMRMGKWRSSFFSLNI